jgi:sulfonate transport system permease protein
MLIGFTSGFPSVAVVETTSLSAFVGFITAFVIAVLTFVVATSFPISRSAFRSTLLVAYVIPTFALAEIGLMLGVRENLPWVLVTLSLTLPFLLNTIEIVGEVERRYATNKLGTRTRRFRLIGLRYAFPEFLASSAMCVPWAVLVAMLAELATGQKGLGIGLYNAMPYGLVKSLPYCLIAAAISCVPYGLFLFLARFSRGRLNLNERVLSRENLLQFSVPNHFFEIAMVIIVVGVLWTTLHWQVPYIVPNWTRVLAALKRHELYSSLFDASARTFVGTAVALTLGFGFGCFFALFGQKFRQVKSVLVPLLLATQILPLIVFIPLVATLQRSVDEYLAPVHQHFQETSWWASLFSGVVVATLASTYTAYHSASSRLQALPKGLGPIIAAFGPFNLRVIRYVYLPWLTSSFSLAVEIAIPRIFLAVLISEYMITGVGLGGLLWKMRGQRDYDDAWCTLLVVILASSALFVAAGLLSRLTKRFYNIQYEEVP